MRIDSNLSRRKDFSKLSKDGFSDQQKAPGSESKKILHGSTVRSIAQIAPNKVLRKAQGDPKAMQTRYVDIYDNAPVGYCILNEKFLIVQANRTAASLLGLTRWELLNQGIASYILKEDQETYFSHRNSLFASNELQSCDVRMVKTNGTIYWVRLHSVLKPGNDGKLFCRTTFSDITQSKRMEEALKAQRDFFHLMAENLSDFIDVFDPEGSWLGNNLSCEQHCGAPEKLAPDFFDKIHPDDRERVRQAIPEIARGGQVRQLEFRFLTADGNIRDMESRCSLIRGRDEQSIRVLVAYNDITERKQYQDHVRQLSLHDPLTQLPNRRLLNDRLGQAMALCLRTVSFSALMFIDLDDFKQINDKHGHDMGDLILIEAADRLTQNVREIDTVARFGGDEFVVLLSHLDKEKSKSLAQAGRIAEKLLRSLSRPYLVPGANAATGNAAVEHCCTASIGITLLEPQDTNPGDILKRADSAMYQAKKGGGNQLQFGLAPDFCE